MQTKSDATERTGRLVWVMLILVFAVAAAAIVAAGAIYYHRYERDYRAEVERQLAAVADLKVGEIVRWRRERLGDASVFYKNANFTTRVRRCLEAPDDVDNRRKLHLWLRKLQAAYTYDRVFLTDAQGEALLSAPDTPEPVADHLRHDVADVLRAGRPAFLDFHRDRPDQPITIAVLVPILDEEDGGRPLGVLVLRVDPSLYLYPMISRWPTSSRTAETLLVRREGEEVVFLNPLRFRPDAALALRIPLDRAETPAVQAALGREGVVEGRDYRGVPVAAYVRTVPESPWFLVARMDTSEVYAPLRARRAQMIAVVVLLLLGVGAGIGWLWQGQRARFVQEWHHLARQRQLALDAARLGWWHYDPLTRITEWDRRYREIHGVEDHRCPNEEILARLHPDDLPRVQAAIETALNPSDPKPVQCEYRVNRPDGTVRWVEAHGLAMFEGDGKTRRAVSLVGTVEDITERKQAEARLLHLNTVLRAVRDVNQLITHEKDRDTLLQRSCDILADTRGYTKAWIGLVQTDGRLAVTAQTQGRESCASLPEQINNGLLPECWRRAMATHDVVVMYRNPEDCGVCPLLREHIGSAVLATALCHAGQTHGVLVVALPAEVAQDEQEHLLFQEVAGDIAFALSSIAAEKERERSTRTLEAIFDSASDGILLADIATRRFVNANRAIAQMLGCSRDEVLQMALADLHPPESLPHVEAQFERQCRGEIILAPDIPLRRKDGSILTTDVKAARVNLDGRPYLLGIFRDITERKQAEEQLREMQRQMEFILGATKTGLDIIDAQYNLRYVDPAWARAYGEWRGHKCYDYFMGRSAPCSPCGLHKPLETGERTVSEEILVREGNRPVQVTSIPYQDRNGEWLVAEVNVDISERKQAEAQREALEAQLRQVQKIEAVGLLAGGVAHDFNNILTGISGFTRFALDQLQVDCQAYEDLTEVLGLVSRAETLTRQLLAFGRKQTLQLRVFNINQTVRDMTKMLGRLIGENIDLTFTPAADLGNVHADAGQIEQVLVNLVVNARDAMPDGGKLTLETANIRLNENYARAHHGVTPGEYVMLAVSDTGCGMDAATREHIFQPFFTTKQPGKGTGLGLATVYGIVKQHGGNIWVYSEPGQGTTFKVYLPRVLEAAEAKAAAAPVEAAQRGTETILFVEDDAAVRGIVKRVLEERGYTVLTAATPAEADDRLSIHRERIALLLTDVVMPERSGRQLYEAARAKYPHLRVLYVSGYTDDAIVHHGVLEPGTPFIQKPFTPDGLARKVREVLGDTSNA